LITNHINYKSRLNLKSLNNNKIYKCKLIMSKIIGIDSGTGNSCVAVIENGKANVIVNSEGQRTTPSMVGFKDGERKIGDLAKRQRVINVKNTIYNIKRLMGVTYEQAKQQGILDKLSYEVVADKDGNPRVVIEGKHYSPEEITAMILSKLKITAEEYYGESVTDAVITCPAWFDDPARQAVKNAGVIAGLNVLKVINEPTAAIMSSNIDINTNAMVMVADIGQGTVDFSICDISDGVVEIKASKGDVFLGGADFDNAIAEWIVSECKSQYGVDLSKDTMAMQRVLETAEKVKIELSSALQSEINLPYITVADGVPVHFVQTITRAKMDSICEHLVKRIIDCGKEALIAADVKANELSYILLVGGQTRAIAIQEALTKEFNTELNKSVNPDEAVALGAAIQANVITGGEGSETAMLLLDVTPLNLGIETMGGVMTKMIEANTTIPTRKSQIFSTAEDNQSAVTINVLQGCRPMAKDNKSIGVFNLEGIMPAKKGIPQIEVTFDIDASGILSVTAVDKATGKEQKVTIQSKTSISDEEIERMKSEAEAYAEEDRKTQENLEKMNKIESLISSINSIMESTGEKEILTEDDKNYFNEKKVELEKMKEEKSLTNFESLEKEIQTRFYSISSRAYGNPNENQNNNFDFSQFTNQNI
jgi:molecular chaperone DnaK